MIEALDLKLDESGDLAIEANDLVLVYWEPEGIAQRVQTLLRLDVGEWILDVTAGVPWRDLILTRRIERPLVDATLRSKILSVPGIAYMVDFTSTLDRATRLYTFSFRAAFEPLETGMEDEESLPVLAFTGNIDDGQLELLCVVEGVGGFF